MRTLITIPQVDNKLNWVIRIHFDYTIAYLSTRYIRLTRRYEADVISPDTIGEQIDNGFLDINNGGMSKQGKYTLKLNLSSGNSLFNKGVDEYYPNSKHIINRKIDIGIAWDDNTTDDEIVWLETSIVNDFKISGDTVSLVTFSNDDFSTKDLLHYYLQNDYDNGISYSDDIPDGNKGKFLPTVYGVNGVVPSSLDFRTDPKYFSPTLLAHESNLKHIVAWHECFNITTTNNYLFRWIKDANNFLKIKSSNYSETNNSFGAFKLLDFEVVGSGASILGSITILNIKKGSETEIHDISGLTSDLVGGVTINPTKKIAVKIDANIPTDIIGVMGKNAEDIKASALVIVNSGIGLAQFEMYNESIDRNSDIFQHSDIFTTITTVEIEFGADLTAKRDDNLPYTSEEIGSMQFVIRNMQNVDTGVNLIAYRFRLELQNILIAKRNPRIIGNMNGNYRIY